MGTKLPEDMVYTITSGFYPQLFSSNAPWKRDAGKGRLGMQWLKKGGYSKGSISNPVTKMEGKEVGIQKSGKGTLSHFFSRMRGGTSWMKAFEELKGGTKEWAADPKGAALVEQRGMSEGTGTPFKDDQEGGLGMSQAQMETNLTWTRFIGNNEMYKLWGTKVWHQEGKRKKTELMEEDLNAWLKEKPNLPMYLETLYKDKEGALIKLAKDMAEDVFGKALNQDNLRDDLEHADEADVPEEERKEVRTGGKGTSTRGKSLEADTMDKSWKDISQARNLDIKYRMRDGTTIYMDSTEMPIHQAGSHGLMEEGLDKMKLAIEEAIDMGDNWVGKLRNAVVKLFIKNIDTYNDTIGELLTAGEDQGKTTKGKGIKSFKKLLKKITDDNKKAAKIAAEKGLPYSPKIQAAVPQLARMMGKEYEKAGSKNTALKFITHTIVNLAGQANNDFREGYYVGSIGPKGKEQNTYASVPMQLKNLASGEIAFDKGVLGGIIDPDKPPVGVTILQGRNHLLALMVKDQALTASQARETQARQIQAFQNGKIIGVSANSQIHAEANAQFGLRAKARQSTVVTFNPKSGEHIAALVESAVSENVDGDVIQKSASSFMSRKSVHKLSKKLPSKHNTKFWALPYIGVMEYPTKRQGNPGI